MSYQRPNIARMTGYAPGEQPTGGGVIKLNTNENPYPPAPAVLEALGTIDGESLRRYPPPLASPFLAAAARLHGLGEEQIVATNGGDELLRLAITTFVEPGRPIGVAEPSYSLYPVLADIHDSPTHRVPLCDNWSLPDDFAAQMNRAAVQLTLIVNPHAPSGRLESPERIAAIASELDGVLLLDEAYVDFVDPEIAHATVRLLADHPNLLILRTLSKGYSLAGLRFGYGMGQASLIDPIRSKSRDSYNKDIVGQRLATAALEARDHASRGWAAVRSERHRVAEALTGLGFAVEPSQSNFLLATVPPGQLAAELYQSLKQGGVLVRWFNQPRLTERLRITIGTPAENDTLLARLTALING
jgi:histidinol-phosphate aminotransferase